jgi:hypothetical protein
MVMMDNPYGEWRCGVEAASCEQGKITCVVRSGRLMTDRWNGGHDDAFLPALLSWEVDGVSLQNDFSAPESRYHRNQAWRDIAVPETTSGAPTRIASKEN